MFKQYQISSICETTGGQALMIGTMKGEIILIDIVNEIIINQWKLDKEVVVHWILEDHKPDGLTKFWAVGPSIETLKEIELSFEECELYYNNEDAFYTKTTRKRVQIAEKETLKKIDSINERIQKKIKKLDKRKKEEKYLSVFFLIF